MNNDQGVFSAWDFSRGILNTPPVLFIFNTYLIYNRCLVYSICIWYSAWTILIYHMVYVCAICLHFVASDTCAVIYAHLYWITAYSHNEHNQSKCWICYLHSNYFSFLTLIIFSSGVSSYCLLLQCIWWPHSIIKV